MNKDNRNRSMSAPFAATLTLVLSTTLMPQAQASEYDTVCGKSQIAADTSGQKASYCAAAKQSLDAASKDSALTMIYAAVSGTCVTACINEAWIPAGAIVCQGGAVGASVAEVVMTKNLSGALGAIVGGMGLMKAMDQRKAAQSAASTSSSSASSSTTTAQQSKGNKEACMTAALTGVSAIMHNMSKNSSQRAADDNLKAAKDLASTTPGGPTVAINTPSSGSTATGLSTPSSKSTALNTGNGGDAGSGNTGPCAASGSGANALSCAATADPKIAGMISSPDFQKAFQKSSGMSLDKYLTGAGKLSASDAIKAAAGGGSLDSTSMDKLDTALANAEKEMPANFNAEASAAYASGGGHGGSADSGDADFNNMMSGLMGKLLPKSEQGKKNGVSEVDFSGAKRNLASVTAEDPTVSLFDRVAFRYSHVTPRLLSDPSQRALSDWSMTTSVGSDRQRN